MPEFESGEYSFSVEYGVDRLASWWTVVVTKLGLEATRLVRLKDGLTSINFNLETPRLIRRIAGYDVNRPCNEHYFRIQATDNVESSESSSSAHPAL